MNKTEFHNLLAEISAADLSKTDDMQLAEWFRLMGDAIHDKNLTDRLEENELNEWKVLFEKINEEFEHRGIIKFDLVDIVNTNPEIVENLLLIMPIDNLKDLATALEPLPENDFKKKMNGLIRNCVLMRMSVYNLGSDLAS